MFKRYFNLNACPTAPENYNNGHKVEWNVGFALTGTPSKANNKPAEEGGDVLDWQVKSPKATLTGRDNCNGYIFGFADADFFYEMSKDEFADFIAEFGYMDRDSKTKKEKMRIKSDSTKMRKWLEVHAR